VTRVRGALLAFAAQVTCIGIAAADPASADKLAAEANDAAKAGRFVDAAHKFSAAFKEDPSRPNLFCNVGISYFKGQDLPHAHLLLGLCLDRAQLDPDLVKSIRAVLDSIEGTMRAGNYARVTFTVAPTNASLTLLEIGDDATFTGNRTVWLGFGPHDVRVHAAGYADQTKHFDVGSSTAAPIDIVLVKPETTKPDGTKPDGTKPDGTKLDGSKPLPSGPTAQPPARPSKLWPALTTAPAVAGAVVAVVALHANRSAASRASIALDFDTFDQDDAETTHYYKIAAVAGAAAAAFAGVSAYLWIRALRAPTVTRLDVTPTAGGAAVSLHHRF
jgi:hypothetical protein